jgi:glucuronate isomerase
MKSMSENSLVSELREGLQATPMLDAHTHLTGGRMTARGLHDILLYHMVVSDLYAAGCPSGARLTEYPGWPSREEARARLREAIPYLPRVQNTSCFWGVRIILRDLYGWNQPITGENWEQLDGMIRQRADDRSWQREILHRTNIPKLTTELARRESGADDDLLHYSMEWAFFTRTQRGEYDTALYELERCWGQPPGSPIPHAAGKRPPTERRIQTLEDVHAAMEHYVAQLAAAPVLSMATHISTEIAFREVTEEEMASALSRRNTAGITERDVYASYVHEIFLRALAAHAARIVFQFSFAAEPLPHETASLVPQRAIADLAAVVARHPRIKFLGFVSSRHADQSLCTLCRELPNLSLGGYWWHNFFPGAMRHVMEERLDMLPTNKQIGFFSDAYSLEWTYAKSVIVRNQMAQVLEQKIRQGQYTMEESLAVARGVFFDAPQQILGMKTAK